MNELQPSVRLARRIITGLSAVVLGGSASACSSSGNHPDKAHAVERSVDVSAHTSHCHDPCSMSLYKRPEASKYPEDASGTRGYVQRYTNAPGRETPWPQQGDKLSVICQVIGQVVTDKHGRSSKIWDVTLVPGERLNDTTYKEASQQTPKFGVKLASDGSVAGVYAMAPDIWLGDKGVDTSLPACTTTELPFVFKQAN